MNDHWHGNRFGHTRWKSLVMYESKLVAVYLDIVLVSAQDRCTVSVERTTGLEIILHVPDGTLR
jgi:hypothetical protein